MIVIVWAITLLLVPLALFAGPYRAFAFKLRTFAGIGLGIVTWLGVLIAFPICIDAFPPQGPWALPAWAALILCAWVQMFFKWCITPPRDAASPHCWFGKWAEPVFAAALAFAAHATCGFGGMVFFLTGYGCSTADWLLRRLRRWCQAWTPDDTQRLLAPVRIAAARATAWVQWASPICGRLMLRYGLLLASATATALRCLWLFLVRRAQQPAPTPPQGQYVRPPTFGGRVMSYVVGHMVISAITGVIGFNIIAVPFAIILWFLGWDVSAPWHVKEQGAMPSPASRTRWKTRRKTPWSACASSARRFRTGGTTTRRRFPTRLTEGSGGRYGTFSPNEPRST